LPAVAYPHPHPSRATTIGSRNVGHLRSPAVWLGYQQRLHRSVPRHHGAHPDSGTMRHSLVRMSNGRVAPTVLAAHAAVSAPCAANTVTWRANTACAYGYLRLPAQLDRANVLALALPGSAGAPDGHSPHTRRGR